MIASLRRVEVNHFICRSIRLYCNLIYSQIVLINFLQALLKQRCFAYNHKINSDDKL